MNSTETPSTAALHWTRADPSIAHLYKHLVDRATAPLLGANMRYDVPTVQQEHALLMRCVRIFMRMGCDAHALDLGEHDNTQSRESLAVLTPFARAQ